MTSRDAIPRRAPQGAPPWDELLRWIEAETAAAARRYRLPPDEREELRQSVSLRVLESLGGFVSEEGPATLRTWVRRQAGWGVADYWRDRLRRERRETTDVDPSEVGDHHAVSPESAALRAELAAALRSCLAKLTDLQRRRFLESELARDAREPLQSVARRFEVSLDSLKESIAKARVSLRACLRLAGFAPADRTDSLPPESSDETV